MNFLHAVKFFFGPQLPTKATLWIDDIPKDSHIGRSWHSKTDNQPTQLVDLVPGTETAKEQVMEYLP